VCLSIVLLFVAYVIGEVASIAILGSHVGTPYTLLVLAIGVGLGVMLLAGRALATLQNAAEAWSRGEEIGQVVASSALVGLAGILFLVPGLLSDAAALVIILPPVRARMAGKLVGRVKVHAARLRPRGGAARGGGEYIDADAVEQPSPSSSDGSPGDPPRSLP